jgi:hypothetical protein
MISEGNNNFHQAFPASPTYNDWRSQDASTLPPVSAQFTERWGEADVPFPVMSKTQSGSGYPSAACLPHLDSPTDFGGGADMDISPTPSLSPVVSVSPFTVHTPLSALLSYFNAPSLANRVRLVNGSRETNSRFIGKLEMHFDFPLPEGAPRLPRLLKSFYHKQETFVVDARTELPIFDNGPTLTLLGCFLMLSNSATRTAYMDACYTYNVQQVPYETKADLLAFFAPPEAEESEPKDGGVKGDNRIYEGFVSKFSQVTKSKESIQSTAHAVMRHATDNTSAVAVIEAWCEFMTSPSSGMEGQEQRKLGIWVIHEVLESSKKCGRGTYIALLFPLFVEILPKVISQYPRLMGDVLKVVNIWGDVGNPNKVAQKKKRIFSADETAKLLKLIKDAKSGNGDDGKSEKGDEVICDAIMPHFSSNVEGSQRLELGIIVGSRKKAKIEEQHPQDNCAASESASESASPSPSPSPTGRSASPSPSLLDFATPPSLKPLSQSRFEDELAARERMDSILSSISRDISEDDILALFLEPDDLDCVQLEDMCNAQAYAAEYVRCAESLPDVSTVQGFISLLNSRKKKDTQLVERIDEMMLTLKYHRERIEAAQKKRRCSSGRGDSLSDGECSDRKSKRGNR